MRYVVIVLLLLPLFVTAGSWRIETVDLGYYETGWYSSLALDSSDYPHISYFEFFDYLNGYLKYARWDGDEWQFEHVDTGGDTCYYISLALDSNDHPHISYQKRDDENDLRYAHWDGSEWWVETVDAEDITGYYSSIIIPVLIGNDQKAFKLTGGLEEEGVCINPVIYPAVPKGSALIRVSKMASLSEEELETALDKFRLVGKRLRII